MKYRIIVAGVAALILCAAIPPLAAAGTVEKIKEGTREAVSEVGKEAARAGKAAAETGKEIKEGAVKTGTTIKEGVKEVGQDIKKAYQETRDAVTKEFSEDTRESSGH